MLRVVSEMDFKKLSIFLTLLSLTLIEQFTTAAEVEPIVIISQGKLKGEHDTSRTGKKFVQFLNIPYAAKPERFKASSCFVMYLVEKYWKLSIYIFVSFIGSRISKKMGWNTRCY